MRMTRAFLVLVMGILVLSAFPGFAENPPAAQPAVDQASGTQAQPTAAKVEDPEGKTFVAAGKDWLVGKADIDWTATQAWIKGLGEGWRAPTKDELEAVFKELGQKSPIGQDFIWAEKKDEHSAWHYSFYYREVRWAYFDDHSRYGRAAAVREKK